MSPRSPALAALGLTLLCGCPDNNLGSINATPEATSLSHQQIRSSGASSASATAPSKVISASLE